VIYPRVPVLLFIIFSSLIPKTNAYELTILKQSWGKAKLSEVQAVLRSTAEQFIPLIKELKELKFVVSKTSSSPIVLYKRTKNGELQIKLNTKDRFWCQYVFQFAHELGHVLCGFKKGNPSNQWFEESLCEAASLYALKRLSIQWSVSPPYQNWKDYAPEFLKYRNQRIKNSQFPNDFQLPVWWKKNSNTLSKNHALRKQNLWVAVKLLGIIEQKPESAWSACTWINYTKSGRSKTFEKYLSDWQRACPKLSQKKFVDQVINLFGISTNQNKNK